MAGFERIVLDEKSRVIDMSVKARGFPDWMKRALLIEARAMMQFGLASQGHTASPHLNLENRID